MRTVAATRHTAPDLASKPQVLTWLVYCRENKLLNASEWSLAALLVTLGEGQNITLTVTGMADILGMKRDTVSKAIKSLHAKGLMVPKGTGKNRKTFYRLTMPLQVAQMGTNSCPNGDHNIEDIDQERQEDLHQHPDDDEGAPDASSKRAKRTSSASRSARAGKASSASSSVSADKVPGDSGVPDDPDDEDDLAVPPLEEYVADLEGCVDELARRLGMDPGQINIKVVAKMLREIVMEHRVTYKDRAAVFSDILELFPADYGMWDRFAGKMHPVGYMMEEFRRNISTPSKDDDQDDKVPA